MTDGRLSAINLAAIKEILDAFARSGAEELEVVDGSLRLRILRRRSMAVGASPDRETASADSPLDEAPSADAPIGESLSAESALPHGEAAAGILVTAAMHGVFHRAPAPGAEPFVSVGSRVVRGQQLCILEAMKVFTAVAAPRDGTVASIHVENGVDVKTGQPLFTLAAARREAAE